MQGEIGEKMRPNKAIKVGIDQVKEKLKA